MFLSFPSNCFNSVEINAWTFIPCALPSLPSSFKHTFCKPPQSCPLLANVRSSKQSNSCLRLKLLAISVCFAAGCPMLEIKAKSYSVHLCSSLSSCERNLELSILSRKDVCRKQKSFVSGHVLALRPGVRIKTASSCDGQICFV